MVNPYLTVDLSYLYRAFSAVSKAQLIILGATSANKSLKMAHQKVNPPHTFHTAIKFCYQNTLQFNHQLITTHRSLLTECRKVAYCY